MMLLQSVRYYYDVVTVRTVLLWCCYSPYGISMMMFSPHSQSVRTVQLLAAKQDAVDGWGLLYLLKASVEQSRDTVSLTSEQF